MNQILNLKDSLYSNEIFYEIASHCGNVNWCKTIFDLSIDVGTIINKNFNEIISTLKNDQNLKFDCAFEKRK